jgi:hypothetical protein
MARNVAFKEVRNSLYTDLIACACIPQVDVEGTRTDQLERRFFPAGTAEKILTFDALERLVTWVTPAGFRSAVYLHQENACTSEMDGRSK